MKRNSRLYKTLGLFIAALSTFVVQGQEQTNEALHSYLKIAVENNPGLQSKKAAYEASLQKIPQAGAWSDPELSLGFYTEAMHTVGGKSIGDVSLMQMLPWFGTKKSAQTEAKHMAQMSYKEYEEAIDALTLQIETQWYILQKTAAQLANSQENRQLLEQLEQLALRKFSSPTLSSQSSPAPMATTTTSSSTSSNSTMGGMAMGGSTPQTPSGPAPTPSASMDMGSGSSASGMSDVLRIRLEIIEVENTIERLTSLLQTEKVKFNTMLNRDASEEISIVDGNKKVDFLFNEEDALTMIEANNPMLGMITEQGMAYKAKSEMDKKMSYPMIGLGVQYMILGKTSDPMLAMGNMNGKDMIMPMMTVSLPIFRKKYKAQQEESKYWWKSSEANYANTLNALKAEFYTYKNELENALRTVNLLEKQSTLAETTYNLIIKEFISGKSDLTNVIQVQRQLLDYQLKKEEAIADYNTMVASIQKLLSTQKAQNL